MSKKESKKKESLKEDVKYEAFYVENSMYYTRVTDAYKNRKAYQPLNNKDVPAFIPGTIRDLKVKVGDKVEFGDHLMILEAMKMNNDVKSPASGVIKSILVKEGEMVKKNQPLIEFE